MEGNRNVSETCVTVECPVDGRSMFFVVEINIEHSVIVRELPFIPSTKMH